MARVWFVAEYETTAPLRIEPSWAGELPGLIFHHALDPAGDLVALVFYWESKADFEASRGPLEDRLGPATLRRAAWVRRILVPHLPFWKRFTLYAILLHLVALFGTLTALENYYDWLFEAPLISMDVEESPPINLLQGSPWRTRLVLVNQQAAVAASISALEAKLVGPMGATPILSQWSCSIRGRDSLTVPIETGRLKAGPYRLEVRGRARSGRLRGWKIIDLKRNLLVWRRAPWVDFGLDPKAQPRRRIRALLHAADEAPAGLDCQATLMDEPSLQFGLLEFPGVTNWPEPSLSREGSVSVQTWTTPPLRRFSVIPFVLFFDGKPARSWTELPGHLAIECSPRVGRDHL